MRDFKKTLAKLLPDASWHHPKVRKLERRAIYLQECMKDISSEKMASIRSQIIEGKSKLATAAKNGRRAHSVQAFVDQTRGRRGAVY